MANLHDVDVDTMDSCDRLKFCGYMLELEHSFSGNGCWPEDEASLEDPMNREEEIRGILIPDDHADSKIRRATGQKVPTRKSSKNHPNLVIAMRADHRAEPWIPTRECSADNQSYHHILNECGVQDADMHSAHFVLMMWNTVATLKEHNYIPFRLDVAQHMKEHIVDCDLDLSELRLNDSMRLGTMRYIILRAYINRLVDYPLDEPQPGMLNRPRSIMHRSFDDIRRIFNILTKEIEFTLPELHKNIGALGAHETNIKAIMRCLSIDDQINMKHILRKTPILLHRNHTNFADILDILQEFHIPAYYVNSARDIFRLSPECVRSRLSDLKSRDELKFFWQLQRSLLMVVNYKRVLKRLESLKFVPTRKINLAYLLDTDNEKFIRYITHALRYMNRYLICFILICSKLTEGPQSIMIKESVEYFSKYFGRPSEEIKLFMKQHPHMSLFSIATIQMGIEYLIERGFSHDDILYNFYVTIYPL